jgi:hypothetical protein
MLPFGPLLPGAGLLNGNLTVTVSGAGGAAAGGGANISVELANSTAGGVALSGTVAPTIDLIIATRSTKAAYFRRANNESLTRAAASSTGLVPTGAFSIAFWVYQISDNDLDENSGVTHQVILCKHDLNTVGNYWIMRRGSSNGFEFYVTGLSAGIEAPASVCRKGSWHHVVCRYDGVNTLYMMVDGTQYTQSVTGTPSGDTTRDFAIGSDGSSSARHFNGLIDEVSYFSADIANGGASNLWNDGVGKTYSQLTTAQKANLVSWWTMDEASGTRNDSHGTNHLTDNNTVESAAGAVSAAAEAGGILSTYGAASFSKDLVIGTGNGAKFVTVGAGGDDAFFTRAHTADFDISNVDFSFSTWVKFPSPEADGGYLINWQGNNAGERSWFLQYNSGTARQFQPSRWMRLICAGVSSDLWLDLDMTGIDITKWFNITIWYDSASNTAYMSVNDGTPVSGVVPGGFAADSGTDYLQIQGSGQSAPYGAPPSWCIDSTGFWRKKLSGAEVTSLYNGGRALSYDLVTGSLLTSLKAWWDFQEESGTRYDSSGNGYHLTDNNTTPAIPGATGYGISGGISVSGSASKNIDLIAPVGQTLKSAAGYIGGYWTDATKHHFADEPFTAAVWVKTNKDDQRSDSLSYIRSFMGPMQGYGPSGQEWGFAYGVVSGVQKYRFIVRGPSPTYTYYSADVNCTNDWTLLVMKHVPADDKIYYSVNGGVWSSFDIVGGLNKDTGVRFSFNGQVGFNNTFHRMQGAAVWAKAIDDTELSQLYNSGKGCRWDQLPASLKTSDCQLYLDGTEGSGFAIADKSGNGFDTNTLTYYYNEDGVAVSGDPAKADWRSPGVLEIPAGAAITASGGAPFGGDLTADVSGSAVSGGAVTPNIDLIRDLAGGALTDGIAPVNYDHSEMGSGGVDTGGAGSFALGLVYTGVGGAISSGAGSFILDLVYTGVGGLLSGGTAPYEAAQTITVTGEGGALSGGAGPFAIDLVYTGVGGAASSGAAPWLLDFVWTGVGGAAASGAASGVLGLVWTGVGGSASTGNGQFTIGLTATGIGSADASGSGVIAKDLLFSPSGAATTSGVGSFAIGLVYVGVGTLQASGAASGVLDLVWTGVGGEVSGGSGSFVIDMTYAPSGAATTSGDGLVVKDLVFSPSGTATSGGIGPFVIDLLYTGVGGAVTSGTAPYEAQGAIVITGSGGADLSGAGSYLIDLVATGVGGAAASGSAPASGNLTYVGTGSTISSGSGVFAIDLIFAPSGALASSGAAPFYLDMVWVGVGGVVTSGGAPDADIGIVWTGVGGLASSGAASFAYDAVWTGVGGAVTSGTTTFTLDLVYSGSGSAQVGGTLPYEAAGTFTGSGGAATGGAGSYNINLIAPIAGGAATSGTAPAYLTFSWTGVGGGATTGIAAWSYDAFWVGSGSASISGTPSVVKDLILAPAGSATLGGSSPATKDMVFAPSGTVTTGGSGPAYLGFAWTGVGGAVSSGSALPVEFSVSVTGEGSAVLDGLGGYNIDLGVDGQGEMVLAGEAPWKRGQFSIATGFVKYRRDPLHQFPPTVRKNWPLGHNPNWPLRRL